MSHNKLQWNCCDKVTVTKWERWVRGRVGVPVHIGSRKITQVSSGMNYKYSYSFIYKFGDNRNFRCSSNSAPNQFAREKFKHSRVEFQTFRSWIGQIKTYVNAHSKTPADPSRTGTFQIVSCRTDRHARAHPHRRTQTQTQTNKSIRASTRTMTCTHRRTQQQFRSPAGVFVTLTAKSRRAHNKI